MVRVEVEGSQIRIYLDGELILSGEDAEPIESGDIKMVAPPGVSVRYDDFQITETRSGMADGFLMAAVESASDNAVPPSVIAALEAAAGREATYADDFSEQTSGLTEEQGEKGYAAYADGTYQMATHPDADTCCVGPQNRGNYSDVVAQIDMRLDPYGSEDELWGSFSIRNSPEGSYNFDLNLDESEQQVYLQIGHDDRTAYLELEQTTGVALAEARWHNLIVVLVGDEIAAFIDGRLAASLADDTLENGSFTVYAGWGTQLSVDNLRLWDVADVGN
jgi:hypothetical protein